MPIIVIIILAILIAQVGFWDTLGAILGAAAMFALFVLLLVLLAALVGYLLFRLVRRRL